ncbi:hypothetical protein E4T48_06402 [Aureobasidium sp. EXF-10727]|nr:hypothetical protein E4T48_06402 [Aureobasidium sp. EXF-10727]KAI4725300.1 hypothetical protein E4T49_06983 [Aureobasidium sp. EXF-10728]
MAYRATALVALSGLASLINAKPIHPYSSTDSNSGHHGSMTSSSSYTTSSSYQTFPTQVASSKNLLLSNGFPNLSPSALTDVNNAAHGTLSNATANITFAPDSLTNFQLIAFNEFFEVAFFTSLLTNITTNVPGFEIPAHLNSTFIIDTLIAVQAQEELHAINANTKLPVPLQTCEYKFPTTKFADAIQLAATFTDVVMGTLQDVAFIFADDGNKGVVNGIVSVVGQEGEQNGFYRSLLSKIPSAQPFLTASARDFAFSALNQNFVVEGSCDISGIPLKVFEVLTLETADVGLGDQVISLSFDISGYHGQPQDLEFVLINGQNVPIVQELKNVRQQGNKVTFDAQFLQKTDLLFGLSVGAVVRKGEALATVGEVIDATVFGPALIEVA